MMYTIQANGPYNNWSALLSNELQDLLLDFTQMEEMLCSLASPCFLMWVSKGGQYKARGNVITFSQDVTNLCTTLPRLPEDLDVLVVRKPISAGAGSDTFKDFHVRKDKVFRLLCFLKEHNHFYKDIAIRPPDLVDLPDDASVIHRLPAVEPREDGSEQVTSRSPLQEPVADDLPPDHSELAHEQNTFVPSIGPLPSEEQAIAAGMNDTGLTTNDDAPLAWPPIGLALSEYSTHGLFSMAFPTLFPTAAADFSLRRDHNIHLHEWVKHLMRYCDSRFATHPRFRFFALNLIFRHRSMQRGKYLFSRNISHHNMTIGQLKHALSQQNGPRLASDIVRCLKTVKATRPYWNMEGGKLRDMIAQIGTPTFFYTLSMADMSWPDLHKLMPDDPFAPGLTPAQSTQIRFHNVATNPHIVASYLSTKHQLLMDTILQHLDVHDTARVSDYWYRFEWQARGSGKRAVHHPVLPFSLHRSGHIHGFLWLENAIAVDDVNWNNAFDRARLVDYFSRFITAYNPHPDQPRSQPDCLLLDLLDPTIRAHWDMHADHTDLCNRCQKHGSSSGGHHHCVPSQCHKRGSCRFHFPFAVSPLPAAFIERSSGSDRKRFSPSRNDPWLNQHSTVLLLAWRANMDLQPVLDRTAAMKYVSKYASKPEVTSESYHQSLAAFCSRLPRHLPAERAAQSLFARMAADRDISAQEAVHLLLGENLVGCSRSFVNLNADHDAAHAFTDSADFDDNDAAFKDNFFQRYCTRLPQHEQYNAIQYCRAFDVSHSQHESSLN
jgi:hypothetical protein